MQPETRNDDEQRGAEVTDATKTGTSPLPNSASPDYPPEVPLGVEDEKMTAVAESVPESVATREARHVAPTPDPGSPPAEEAAMHTEKVPPETEVS